MCPSRDIVGIIAIGYIIERLEEAFLDRGTDREDGLRLLGSRYIGAGGFQVGILQENTALLDTEVVRHGQEGILDMMPDFELVTVA